MQSRSQQAQDQALVREMKVLENTAVEKERVSTLLHAAQLQNTLLALVEDFVKKQDGTFHCSSPSLSHYNTDQCIG
jgi:hypothetical protein